MSVIGSTLDILEGESKRFLWLPPVSAGYVTTLSSSGFDFVVMIVTIVGARLVTDLIGITEESEHNTLQITTEGARDYLFRAILLAYLLGFLYTLQRLVIFFSYDRPVVVGLLGLYLGLIAIALADSYIDIESYVVPIDQDDTDD